jgi:type I restriction enzyme S subunit
VQLGGTSALIHRQTDEKCRGTTRTFFTQGILSSLEVPLPDVHEQHRVVAYLDGLQEQVDKLTALQDATQAELDALPPSVLDRAFKGEL